MCFEHNVSVKNVKVKLKKKKKIKEKAAIIIVTGIQLCIGSLITYLGSLALNMELDQITYSSFHTKLFCNSTGKLQPSL